MGALPQNRFLSRAWFTFGMLCRWHPWPERRTLDVSCDWVMLNWVKSCRSLIICTNRLVDSHHLLALVIFLISCLLTLLALIEIVLASHTFLSVCLNKMSRINYSLFHRSFFYFVSSHWLQKELLSFWKLALKNDWLIVNIIWFKASFLISLSNTWVLIFVLVC